MGLGYISEPQLQPRGVVWSGGSWEALTLAAVLVLGGCEALITDADVGTLQVLTGPMGKAQARVLAALIYVLWGVRGQEELFRGKPAPLSRGVCLKGLTQIQNPNFKAHTTGSPVPSVVWAGMGAGAYFTNPGSGFAVIVSRWSDHIHTLFFRKMSTAPTDHRMKP